ncbi:MAG TPA: MazG family protein [Pedococcus sp.]|nr:MazG family protein [Pedococcus sp.]
MAGRLSLLVASPRVAPGLLSRSAWQAVEAADSVLARAADEPLAAALVESGVPVTYAGDTPPPALARELVARAGDGQVVWVSSADADPGLTDAVAAEVSRLPEPPEVEVVVGSWDVQGARLLDVVAVMDRLRSPGGCPWDAEQTHESLVKYLVEESHEAAEAIESGDRDHMREELGDVLLQVAFQSRVAEEHPEQPFDIDDVAGGLVAKLVRRHPHVFADDAAATPEEVERNWELIKAQERAAKAEHAGGEAGHAGLLHGIPASLPALLAADKVVARLERRGDALPPAGDDVASQLLALVARARAEGTDAEAELRRALRALDQQA